MLTMPHLPTHSSSFQAVSTTASFQLPHIMHKPSGSSPSARNAQAGRTLPSSVAPLSSRQASAFSSVDLPAPLGPVGRREHCAPHQHM